MRFVPLLLPLAFTISSASCGKKAAAPTDDQGSGSARAAVAPIAPPTLGVDAIKALNFVYDSGAPAYLKAMNAYKATPRDWAAVQAACEAAIAKDPRHLEAHRLLASALAQQNKPAEATEHLLLTFAGDWGKYGGSVANDPDLEPLRATPHGQALADLLPKLEQNFRERAAAGIWVVGRRSTFKLPSKGGWTTSRGELYAYDADNQRYLRLTHTEHQVEAFVRAPHHGADERRLGSGANEVAIVTFDKIDLPGTGTGVSKSRDAGVLAPTIARAAIQILDATTFAPVGKKVTLPAAREIRVGYAAGDQLVVALAPAVGRWELGVPTVYAVDKTAGKLTPATATIVSGVTITLDDASGTHAAPGFDVVGVSETIVTRPGAAAALRATATNRMIEVANSSVTMQSLNASPDGQHVAFATWADPCDAAQAPSLYVADTAGTVKHVLTSHSRFDTRWLSPTLLAYEDDESAVRVWDLTTGRETMRFAAKAGLALSALSPTPKPACKTAAPAPAATGSGSAGDVEIEIDPTAPVDQPVVAPQ